MEGGLDQHKRADQFRPGRGEVQRDHPSSAPADDDRRGGPEMFEQCGGVQDVLARTLSPLALRLAEAGGRT